jgi:hypothetical protein
VKGVIAEVRCSSDSLGWISELIRGTGNYYSIENYTKY